MTETNANAIYKVGDKVRILRNIDEHKLGEERIINRYDPRDKTYEYGFEGGGWVSAGNIEKVADKPTKNQRISALEAQVSELLAKVEALEALPKPTEVAEMFAKAQIDAQVKAETTRKKVSLTPNELRKAIIAEARSFVEKYSGTIRFGTTPLASVVGDITVKLFVNDKKRTVTAVPYLVHAGCDVNSHRIRIAKCAPGDVFNADIGKAIALGRALGLDVSKFEQAVQPTEVVAGMVAKCLDNTDGEYIETVVGGRSFYIHSEDCLRRRPEKLVAILADTEAQYE